MNKLEELICQLPQDLHQEVADFIEFLLQKRGKSQFSRCASIGWVR